MSPKLEYQEALIADWPKQLKSKQITIKDPKTVPFQRTLAEDPMHFPKNDNPDTLIAHWLELPESRSKEIITLAIVNHRTLAKVPHTSKP